MDQPGVEDPVSADELALQSLRDVDAIFRYAQLNRKDYPGRLDFVKKRFDSLGIKYRQTKVFRFVLLDEICLEPSGNSRLNIMAKGMLEKYGTQIC